MKWNFLYIKNILLSWILTCVKHTSKNPALTIPNWILRTLIFQQNVNASSPGWWGYAIGIDIVPGSNQYTFIIFGINLNETTGGKKKDHLEKFSPDSDIRQDKSSIVFHISYVIKKKTHKKTVHYCLIHCCFVKESDVMTKCARANQITRLPLKQHIILVR